MEFSDGLNQRAWAWFPARGCSLPDRKQTARSRAELAASHGSERQFRRDGSKRLEAKSGLSQEQGESQTTLPGSGFQKRNFKKTLKKKKTAFLDHAAVSCDGKLSGEHDLKAADPGVVGKIKRVWGLVAIIAWRKKSLEGLRRLSPSWTKRRK